MDFVPSSSLPPDHFLSQPRPDSLNPVFPGFVDTTTLAAHDFDVDNRSGFMPPQEPLGRLPAQWEPWEEVLDVAITDRLQLGENVSQSENERAKSSRWRTRVRELPMLSTTELKESEVVLRRSHVVLAWIMHFYIRTIPPGDRISIPPSLTIPLLQVSNHLQLPPVLTYSDDVLYNWKYKTSPKDIPDIHDLQCRTLFTGTKDEEEFYLSSARIELRGVEALSLMRSTMDELFVGDDIAVKRITTYLRRLATVINDLAGLLMSVREGCDPEVFYNQIRPWFKGADSDGSSWTFEGLDREEAQGLEPPTELSGPSAGQSSLIHALDIFLGVDEYSHSNEITGAESSASTSSSSGPSFSQLSSFVPTSSSSTAKQSFLDRMRRYMPRHHRNFLNHLASSQRPLRRFVINNTGPQCDEEANALLEAYNRAVVALKEFRDKHIVIVSLYIVGPARRAASRAAKADNPDLVEEDGEGDKAELKGTGGTHLVKFLKDVRDGTKGAVVGSV
ncbi:hypothetical protein V5O48_005141 [Marasmius crinis-equi]|uniref:Indoleamine 2,3-dioxygenase n=1 Tax=Marasmius crinis-equi TaxID=585013 RepID=A0ABR3FN74_9AGAR